MLLAQTVQELAAGKSAAGGLLMDAKFNTLEELLLKAQDRRGWNKMVRRLLPEEEQTKQREKEGIGEKASDAWMLASGHYYEKGVWH